MGDAKNKKGKVIKAAAAVSDEWVLETLGEHLRLPSVDTDFETENEIAAFLDRVRRLFPGASAIRHAPGRGRKRTRTPRPEAIKPIMVTADVADALGVSETTVENIPEERLPFTVIGNGTERLHKPYLGEHVWAFLRGCAGTASVRQAPVESPRPAENASVPPTTEKVTKKNNPKVAPNVVQAFAAMRGGRR